MIHWLDNNSREYDRQFAAKTKDRLLTTASLIYMSVEIEALHFQFYIASALSLSEEEDIEDDAITVLLKNIQIWDIVSSNIPGNTVFTSAPTSDDTKWDDWAPYKGCTFGSKNQATGRITEWAIRRGYKITVGSTKQSSYGFYQDYQCKREKSKVKQSKKNNSPVYLRVGTNLDVSALPFARLPSEVQASIQKWVGAGFGANICRQLALMYFPDVQIHQRIFDNLHYLDHGLCLDQPASSKDQPQANQLIDHLIELKDGDPDWYYSKDVNPRIGKMQRVFWMSPLQKQLYRRYRDFVQTSNAFLKNAFNMALTLFVVMDSNRHTRIVAAALSVEGTTHDYNWALEHLLEATKDCVDCALPPIVIMSTEDLALNVSMSIQLRDTIMFNCLWHTTAKTIPKNLRPVLKHQYTAFISWFWMAQKALTEEEFDERWQELLDNYGGDDKAQYQLSKLYDTRYRWARYSVDRCFTNNTHATGGVGKAHHLIKRHLHSERTHPLGVFHAVQQRVNEETIKFNRLLSHGATHIRQPYNYVKVMFPLVLSINRRYLSPYACDTMEEAMTETAVLRTQRISKQDWSPAPPSKIASMSKTSNRIDSKSTRVMATKTTGNKKATGARKNGEDSMDKTEDGAITRELMDCKSDSFDPSSFAVLCERDRLQNAGLICAHFFAAMVYSDKYRYHIGLINRRWFLEKCQDDARLDIRNEPFLYATSRRNPPLNVLPSKEFMDSYLRVLPAQLHAIRPPASEAIKEWALSKIDATLQRFRTNAIDGDQESYDRVLESLHTCRSVKATKEDSTSGLHKELDDGLKERSSSRNANTLNNYQGGADSSCFESSGEESSCDSNMSREGRPTKIGITEIAPNPLFDLTNKGNNGKRQRLQDQRTERIQDSSRIAGWTKGTRSDYRAEMVSVISDMNKGKMLFTGSNKRKWTSDPYGNITVVKRASHCSICKSPGHNRATCQYRIYTDM
ncbi:hypothetical protein EC991_007472 [Linnemannia zychae]|nr:hypothetical protein EC991_007472 [Linnemannia zychae]